MKYKAKEKIYYNGQNYEAGETYDLDKETAQALGGSVEPAEAKSENKAEDKPKKATKKSKK